MHPSFSDHLAVSSFRLWLLVFGCCVALLATPASSSSVVHCGESWMRMPGSVILWGPAISGDTQGYGAIWMNAPLRGSGGTYYPPEDSTYFGGKAEFQELASLDAALETTMGFDDGGSFSFTLTSYLTTHSDNLKRGDGVANARWTWHEDKRTMTCFYVEATTYSFGTDYMIAPLLACYYNADLGNRYIMDVTVGGQMLWTQFDAYSYANGGWGCHDFSRKHTTGYTAEDIMWLYDNPNAGEFDTTRKSTTTIRTVLPPYPVSRCSERGVDTAKNAMLKWMNCEFRMEASGGVRLDNAVRDGMDKVLRGLTSGDYNKGFYDRIGICDFCTTFWNIKELPADIQVKFRNAGDTASTATVTITNSCRVDSSVPSWLCPATKAALVLGTLLGAPGVLQAYVQTVSFSTC